MAALGYVEGKDVVFDFHFADGNPRNFPGLAVTLVAANPDVIVASTTSAAVAAARATATIPIVFTYVSNPADLGGVASITHPGGHITGITDFGDDLAVKLIEMSRALSPKASRIAVLVANNPAHRNQVTLMQAVAGRVGLALLPALASTPEELDTAFATIATQHADALIVLGACRTPRSGSELLSSQSKSECRLSSWLVPTSKRVGC